eukprot:GEMP01036570.1.p1 GENE.GEMP01036570.1~~GEMP01036570.1.p1  ORF type:complete len:301 (+),score=74.88 GEMP01036570.1:381-1283(+)
MWVFDSHVHLLNPRFTYGWTEDDPGFCRSASVHDWLQACADAEKCYDVRGGLFIETGVDDKYTVSETLWGMQLYHMARANIKGVIAAIPVHMGAEAVDEFLRDVSSRGGSVEALKGGRAILSVPDAPNPLDDKFLEGLRVLEEKGPKVFDMCVYGAGGILQCVAVAEKRPGLTFVMEHLAYIGGDDSAFREAMRKLHACPNVVLKISGVEEWRTPDESPPLPWIDFVLRLFDADRIMVGSSWYFSNVYGNPYGLSFDYICLSFDRCQVSESDRRKMLHDTAVRVYNLSLSVDQGASQGVA